MILDYNILSKNEFNDIFELTEKFSYSNLNFVFLT